MGDFLSKINKLIINGLLYGRSTVAVIRAEGNRMVKGVRRPLVGGH